MKTNPEHEAFIDRVFCEAVIFRLHRYYGRGGQDRMQTKSFAEARAAAEASLQEMVDSRILMYAVNAEGRSVLLPQPKWDHFASLLTCRCT